MRFSLLAITLLCYAPGIVCAGTAPPVSASPTQIVDTTYGVESNYGFEDYNLRKVNGDWFCSTYSGIGGEGINFFKLNQSTHNWDALTRFFDWGSPAFADGGYILGEPALVANTPTQFYKLMARSYGFIPYMVHSFSGCLDVFKSTDAVNWTSATTGLIPSDSVFYGNNDRYGIDSPSICAAKDDRVVVAGFVTQHCSQGGSTPTDPGLVVFTKDPNTSEFVQHLLVDVSSVEDRTDIIKVGASKVLIANDENNHWFLGADSVKYSPANTGGEPGYQFWYSDDGQNWTKDAFITCNIPDNSLTGNASGNFMFTAVKLYQSPVQIPNSEIDNEVDYSIFEPTIGWSAFRHINSNHDLDTYCQDFGEGTCPRYPNVDSYDDIHPVVTGLPNGQFAAAWQVGTNWVTTAKYNPTKDEWTTPVLVANGDTPPGDNITPSIMADDEGNCYITWYDIDSTNLSLYYQGLPDYSENTNGVAGTNFTNPTVGISFAFHLTPSGQIAGWGQNVGGCLGYSSNQTTPVPVDYSSYPDVIGISANYGADATLFADGSIGMRGSNSAGVLGADPAITPYSQSPYIIKNSDGSTFNKAKLSSKAIGCGMVCGAVVGSDGKIYTWGDDAGGGLGHGYFTGQQIYNPLPVKGPDGVTDFSGNVVKISGCMNSFAALLADGTLRDWGTTLANGNSIDTWCPAATTVLKSDGTPLTNVIDVAGSLVTFYALCSDGTVWAWGQNDFHCIANTSTPTYFYATQVMKSATEPLVGATAIAACDYSVLALLNDGIVYGWGDNRTSQLGVTGSTNYPTPLTIPTTGHIASIYIGEQMGGATDSNNVRYAWGSNMGGCLGDGTTTAHSTPEAISPAFSF